MMSESNGWEKLDSFVDILKSMGCVFYLPLNSQDATTDMINGNNMVLGTAIDNNHGEFRYSEQDGMYKVSLYSTLEQGEYIARWPTSILTSEYFGNNEMTVHCEMLIKGEDGTQNKGHTICILNNLSNIDSMQALTVDYNATSMLTNYPKNTILYLGHTFNNQERKYYQNGKLYNVYSVHNPYLPSSWRDSTDNNIYIGPKIQLPAHNIDWLKPIYVYIRNYKIFNRVLSQEEILQLQNYTSTSTKSGKRRVKSLSITASDVVGRKTNTTINYTATWEYKYEDGTREEKIETGTATSEEFPQNTSTTDTVQREISFTYGGKTAKTTITQGVWVDQEYTINLNSQWRQSSVTNPDSTLYDGVYESYSNKGTHNSGASMYITINGYSNFKLYIRSYAESSYDYVMVSQLDKTLTYSSSYSDTSLVKSHTCGSQNSGTSIGSYKLVEFTGIDGGEHTIQIIYRKDSSSNVGNDCGYVLIPKDQ